MKRAYGGSTSQERGSDPSLGMGGHYCPVDPLESCHSVAWVQLPSL